MIQRIIYTALSQGIAALRNDPDTFQALFEGAYGLDPSEVAKFQTYFAKHPINLYQGYPQAAAKFPLITIILASEEQTDPVFSHQGGTITDPTDPNYGAPQHSAIWHHTYQLLCYSENVDVCLYMYEMAKAAIVSNYDYLRQSDVDDITMSGMELSPDEARLPEHMFVRVLQIRCRHELLLVDINPTGKAYAVNNIFLPPGSDRDDGGITPGVSVGITSDGT